MTLPANGTLKRITVGIAVAIFMFMSGAILSNSSRIAVAEAKIQALVDIQVSNIRTMETIRTENRDEHREIKGTLAEIAKEIRK